jgi:hypothetical protein
MQEERDDGRPAHVRSVHVADAKFDAVLHSRLPRVVPRAGHECRIDLNAHAFRAELFRRGDGDSPVAGAEVVHDIARAH